mgnify:CR=1 FL=1
MINNPPINIFTFEKNENKLGVDVEKNIKAIIKDFLIVALSGYRKVASKLSFDYFEYG